MNEKNSKKQLIEKIQKVSNILVTVARDPSVDQLAAALALTIILDKIKKRSTAVFSGEIPPVMNFLEPEKTFENNANSLRDFIVLLDKDKADRLKMKTEGNIVKILITPYRTKITPDDLSFADGDFNVELVIAIGINKKGDLDEALSAHGRIFHDAVTATLNISDGKDSFGSINWRTTDVNSHSELIAELAHDLGGEKPIFDEQISTALLTGIVAATDQFRNERTTSDIMKLSAELMAHGANQQLIASEMAATQNETPDEDLGSEPDIETNPETEEVESNDEEILEIESHDSNENEATDGAEEKNPQDVETSEGEAQDTAEDIAPTPETTDELQVEVVDESSSLEPMVHDVKPEDPGIIPPPPSREDRLQSTRQNFIEERNKDALAIAQSQLIESELNKAPAPTVLTETLPSQQADPNIVALDNLVAQSGAAANINKDLQDFNNDLSNQSLGAVETSSSSSSTSQSPSVDTELTLPPVVDSVVTAPAQSPIMPPASTEQDPIITQPSTEPITPSLGVPLPPPPPLPFPEIANELPPIDPPILNQESQVSTIQTSDNSAILPPAETNLTSSDSSQFQIPN